MKTTIKLSDKIADHLDKLVIVKNRTTGHVSEKLVSDLLNKAEQSDWWHEQEDTTTIGAIDDFLCDYVVKWSR